MFHKLEAILIRDKMQKISSFLINLMWICKDTNLKKRCLKIMHLKEAYLMLMNNHLLKK